MQRIVLLAFVGIVFPLLVSATDPIEKASVATLPESGDHWVWVPDRILQHSVLFDGDTGEALGMLDSTSTLTPKTPLFSRTRGEFYSVDTAYTRGNRGSRIDFVSIYDARTLGYEAEILLPTQTGQSNSSHAYAELLGDRFLATFNQFPNVSVSIVDLEQRRFVEEIVMTGCAGVFPVGPRRFAALCGDGTALRVDLDASGRKQSFSSSPKFFDAVTDPVAMSAGRDGTRWVFVSFSGQVHSVDFSTDPPTPTPGWSLLDDTLARAGWRPGGLQHVAVHEPTQRLYVVMHQGEAGSHKKPGNIWVYDLNQKKRTDRFELPNLTAAFLIPFAKVEPAGFVSRLMRWTLPSPGVHTIAVSADASPVLFARNAELGAVAVLDALSGKTLRVIGEAGLAGPTLRVP